MLIRNTKIILFVKLSDFDVQLFQYLEHPVDNGRSVSGGYVSLSGHVSGTGLVVHLKSEFLLLCFVFTTM